MTQEKVVFQNKYGKKLVGILHIPLSAKNSPIVIISHGLGSSKDTRKFLAEELERLGVTIFRFDFSGCGESEGDFRSATIQKHVEDLASAVAFSKSMYPKKKIYVMGYCHGAMISAVYASESDDVSGIAMLSAIYSYKDLELILRSVSFLDHWVKKQYIVEDGGRNVHFRNYRSATKLDMRRIVRKIKCPLLVIHGGRDKLMPLGHAFRYYDNVSGTKQLHIVEGANHFFVKKDEEEAAHKIEEWIKSTS